MDIKEIQNLWALLPHGRTLYSYYKDRYSLQLLRYAVRQPTPLVWLRETPLGGLLQKPRLREILAHCNGQLTPVHLQSADGDACVQHYTLSLSTWSGTQTSRRGKSLVLQLNFPRSHDAALRRLLRPEAGHDPFNYRGHPACRSSLRERRYSLAWARLDIDFDSGEALIEEVQSDWVRRVQSALISARCGREKMLARVYRLDTSLPALEQYCNEVLAPHAAMWEETTLSAALFFLREELGMRQIYYHTPESGKAFKNIRWSAPPRSLYTELPRRFCFRETSDLPEMLVGNRRIERLRRRSPELRLQRLAV